MKKSLSMLAVSFLLQACAAGPAPDMTAGYFDNTGRYDVLSGGVTLIPIETPSGTFKVWTKRVGNNPSVKVLLLHGGPGASHEYLEAFDSFFPGAGFEFYYYDQLGSAYSDQPDNPDLWEISRFVDEVEQGVKHWASTRVIFIYTATPGAESWRSNMLSLIRET